MDVVVENISDFNPDEKAEELLSIYKVDKLSFRSERLPEIAEVFKINANAKFLQNEGIQITQQNERVLAFYEQSGAFTFFDLAKLNNATYHPKLPEIEEAPYCLLNLLLD